jgi:hypothetical protein
MTVASQTAHRTLKSPVLPYVTFSSPVSASPQYFAGQNVMTSIQDILERYPGFAAGVEVNPQVAAATATVSRLFAWKKWDVAGTTGSYYWMKCETDTALNTSTVYKMEQGVDANFIQIHQDVASSAPFDFIVGNNTCFYGNGTTRTQMRAFDGVTGTTADRLWGIDSPTITPTISSIGSGNLTAFEGYHYFYTYGNSNNSNESSPSPISACSGLFTNGVINLLVTVSPDTQVDQIYVYRTTDAGSQAPEDCAQITGSPFTNTTQTIADQTLDAALGLRFAPAALANDPPPAANGFAAFASRIWMKAANKVHFTGFEEIINGVQEECVPSGGDGNFFPYPSQINGLAGLDSLVVIATTDTLFGIDGDSLDSFRRYTVSVRNGVKNVTNIATISLEPGTVLAAWLDSANTIWMLGLGEIGLPIRPDTASIDHTKSALAFHINGKKKWLLLADGAGGKLYTFDLDTKLWMPPRIITAHAIHCGETAAGQWDLAIGHSSGKVLKLTPSNYNDDGIPYSASVTTNLFAMTPDTNPNRRGVCDYIAVEGDATQPDSVQICTDDDASTATFQSPAVGVTSDLRTQGINLTEKYYKFNTPAARRVAFKLSWDAADSNFKVYGVDIAFHPVGM